MLSHGALENFSERKKMQIIRKVRNHWKDTGITIISGGLFLVESVTLIHPQLAD